MPSRKQLQKKRQFRMTITSKSFAFVLLLSGAIASLGDCAKAQNITLDGTLGPAQTLTGPTYNINQAVGQTVGSNLFHSFGKFNLDAGETAYFYSDSSIRNILTRVTGGSQSLIDGLIYTNSGNVNLFLINPSGIVFGPNARLDVGYTRRGSFVATTVDALVWPNGGRFSATNPEGPNSLLTIVGDPGGFLSSQRQLQPIVVRSGTPGLSVYLGQSLLLLGGNVSLDGGKLIASGGRVELGGVAGEGTVGLSVNGNELRFNFPDGVARTDVSLTNGAQVNVLAGGGGGIAITARNLNMTGENTQLLAGIGSGRGSLGARAGDIDINATESMTLTNGAFLRASTYGKGDAGSVNIFARETVAFDGLGRNGGPCSVCSIVGRAGVGKGGDINITARSLRVTNGAVVSATTFGKGNAGSVNIFARDTVTFDGVGSNQVSSSAFSSVESTGEGNGGSVNITAGTLAVTNGARLIASTFGQGDAGSVNILTRDTVLFDGVGNHGYSSAAFSNVESTGKGNGGSVNITTGSLAVTNGAYLSARTFNRGDAGSVTINARDTVSIDGVGNRKSIRGVVESSAVLVESTGEGNGGDINITTGLLAVTNSAYLRASTYGKGDAGSVNITVGSLRVTNGAFLDASTGGRGNGGSVNIFARDTVFFDGVGRNGGSCAACSIVGTAGVGKGGGINITTGSLFVTNGALLSATTFGKGDAGSVNINVRDTVTFDAGDAFTTVREGAVGKGGDINITARSLSITNGAELQALTNGRGNAGNIVVNVADSINVSGVSSRGYSSGLLTGTESTASGQGGDIRVTTGALRVSDGAVLSARTFNDKSGGNIIVNANTLELTNGGQFLTTAYSSGRAGNIIVNATDRITISGTDPTFPNRLAKFGRPTVDPAGSASGLFANTDPNSTGNGSSISINTSQLNITDGAGVAVNSEGKGNGGELLIQSDTLTLARQAFLSATTASGEGGNMTLQVQDLLLMRHGSLISTEAGNNGNGGNMNINAKFIVAVPKEDSDIVANAERGRGGNINITTQGIYGLQYRPQRTPLSDITASSQFGVNGTVQINTPGIDPSRGLANLPENLVDTSALIANSCIARSSQQDSSFTITGRGGLPPRPGDAFTSPYPTGTVRSLPSSSAESDTPSHSVEVNNPVHLQPFSQSNIAKRTQGEEQLLVQGENVSSASPAFTTPTPLVEATGWVYGANGEVILTAQAPTVTPHGSWSKPPSCQ
jgi:filamentous hemagglutinin family protein